MPIDQELRKAVLDAVDRGRTQKEIAELAGMDAVSLNRFLRGTRGLGLDSAERIAKAIGLIIVVKRKPRSPR